SSAVVVAAATASAHRAVPGGARGGPPSRNNQKGAPRGFAGHLLTFLSSTVCFRLDDSGGFQRYLHRVTATSGAGGGAYGVAAPYGERVTVVFAGNEPLAVRASHGRLGPAHKVGVGFD